jgi:hypothetical protein
MTTMDPGQSLFVSEGFDTRETMSGVRRLLAWAISQGSATRLVIIQFERFWNFGLIRRSEAQPKTHSATSRSSSRGARMMRRVTMDDPDKCQRISRIRRSQESRLKCRSHRILAQSRIITPKQRLLATQSLRVIEERLTLPQFQRVHRNAIVNVNHVRKLTALRSQRWMITLSNDFQLAVSKRQAHKIRQILQW